MKSSSNFKHLNLKDAQTKKTGKKTDKSIALKSKNKSQINFVERNKSLTGFKKSSSQTSKIISDVYASKNKNKISLKSQEKKTKNFKKKFRFNCRLRKNILRFFSSIFERIFRKKNFLKFKKNSFKPILKAETEQPIELKSSLSQEKTIHKIQNEELNYSNECRISFISLDEVNNLECEQTQVEKAEISYISSLDLSQVMMAENELLVNIWTEQMSKKTSIGHLISLEPNNFIKISQSEQLIEMRTCSSNIVKTESLKSNSDFDFSEANNGNQMNSTSRFESNLTNLYQIHRNIIDKYLKSNLNDENVDESSRAVLMIPSLYEKYGPNLIRLFENQVDEQFLPFYVDSRLVGECLYQLDQRIFNYVFELKPSNRRDISEGYSPFDIISTAEHFSNESGLKNEKKFETFVSRYNYLIKSFNELGYRDEVHPNISAYLIMKYGVYPCLPIDFQINCKDIFQFEILFRILIKNLKNDEKEFMTVMYLCLLLMAFDDQKPIFFYE